MRVQTKTTNYDITPEVEEYLDEKLSALEKLIGMHDEDSVVCDVELERTVQHEHGDIWRAEINLQMEGELLRAEAQGESMNAAIDEVRDDMQRQIKKEKGKKNDFIRRGGARLKEFLRFGK